MAAAESRAEAAFRELLAQGTTQRRQQRPQRLPGLLQHHQQQQERRTVIKPVGEQTPLRPTAMGLQELLLVLGDGASTTGARKAALTALRTRLDAPQQQQGPMQEEQNNHEEHEGERVFQATFPAVLKSMADPSDSCRELALQVFSAFLECGVDVAASLPRLFAVRFVISSFVLPACIVVVEASPASLTFTQFTKGAHRAPPRGPAPRRGGRALRLRRGCPRRPPARQGHPTPGLSPRSMHIFRGSRHADCVRLVFFWFSVSSPLNSLILPHLCGRTKATTRAPTPPSPQRLSVSPRFSSYATFSTPAPPRAQP